MADHADDLDELLDSKSNSFLYHLPSLSPSPLSLSLTQYYTWTISGALDDFQNLNLSSSVRLATLCVYLIGVS